MIGQVVYPAISYGHSVKKTKEHQEYAQDVVTLIAAAVYRLILLLAGVTA